MFELVPLTESDGRNWVASLAKGNGTHFQATSHAIVHSMRIASLPVLHASLIEGTDGQPIIRLSMEEASEECLEIGVAIPSTHITDTSATLMSSAGTHIGYIVRTLHGQGQWVGIMFTVGLQVKCNTPMSCCSVSDYCSELWPKHELRDGSSRLDIAGVAGASPSSLLDKCVFAFDTACWLADAPLHCNSVYKFATTGHPGFAMVTIASMCLSYIQFGGALQQRASPRNKGRCAHLWDEMRASFSGGYTEDLKFIKERWFGAQVSASLLVLPYSFFVCPFTWDLSVCVMFGSFLLAAKSRADAVTGGSYVMLSITNRLCANSWCMGLGSACYFLYKCASRLAYAGVLAMLLVPIHEANDSNHHKIRRWGELCLTVAVFFLLYKFFHNTLGLQEDPWVIKRLQGWRSPAKHILNAFGAFFPHAVIALLIWALCPGAESSLSALLHGDCLLLSNTSPRSFVKFAQKMKLPELPVSSDAILVIGAAFGFKFFVLVLALFAAQVVTIYPALSVSAPVHWPKSQ